MHLLESFQLLFQASTQSLPLLLLRRQLLQRRPQLILRQRQLLESPLFLQPLFGQGLLVIKDKLALRFLPGGCLPGPLLLFLFQLLHLQERRFGVRLGRLQGRLQIDCLFEGLTEFFILRQKLPGVAALRAAQILHLL